MRIKVLITLLLSVSLFAQDSHSFEPQNHSSLKDERTPYGQSLSSQERPVDRSNNNITRPLNSSVCQLSREHPLNERDFNGLFESSNPRTLSEIQLLSSAWVNIWKHTHSYDSNSNLTEELWSLWNTENNVWVTEDKYTYSYDSNNNLTEMLDFWQDAENSVWKNGEKWTFIYDTNNNLTVKLLSWWSSESNIWENRDRWTDTYDSNNNLTEELRSEWDSGSNIWVTEVRYTHSYDSNNKLNEKLLSWRDVGNNVWKIIEKWTYSYDSNNNLIEELESYWDSENSIWAPGRRFTSIYNEEGQLILTTVPFIFGSTITLLYSHGEDGRVVEEIYGYFEQSGVNFPAMNTAPRAFPLIQNFPNPFNPSTTIRYRLPEEANVSLVIYDVRGQVVQAVESGHQSAGMYDVVWNSQTVDGKTISTGAYFARLVAGDHSQVIKMLYLK